MAKKVVLFVVIFGVLAIGITAGMIFSQKTHEQMEDTRGIHQEDSQIPVEKVAEKTIDLYGFYDENDLIMEKLPVSNLIDGKTFEIPQIRGLKSKTVEGKINQSIRQKAENLIKEKYREDVKNFSFGQYIVGNFANILSINLSVSYQEGEKYQYYHDDLNYELVNGCELVFSDIFTKEADLAMIVRRMIYRELASPNLIDGGYGEEWHDTPYYDADKQMWLAEYQVYNAYAERYDTVIKQYVPPYTEYEIEKKVKSFLQFHQNDFVISPREVSISFEEDRSASIPLIDIADNVVIYDKYLTKDSIFEREDIGHKNILSCVSPYVVANTNIKETSFALKNYFYDIECSVPIDTNSEGEENYPAKQYLNGKVEKIQKQMNEKVEEYRNLATTHPEKAYFLFIDSIVTPGSISHSYYNEELGYYQWTNDYTDLVEVEFMVKTIECDRSESDEVLETILAKYRYHNLGFYGSIYDVMYSGNDIADVEIKVPINETIERHIYRVETGEEIKEVKDIFVEPENYLAILERERVSQGGDRIGGQYVLHANYIGGSNKGDWCYIRYENFLDDLNIQVLEPNLLPYSDSQKVTLEEIQDWDEDKLYLAYNEIFARHGHDFQRKEYKDYFSVWDWYQPTEGKNVSLEELNEVEQYNVAFIKSVIDAKQ